MNSSAICHLHLRNQTNVTAIFENYFLHDVHIQKPCISLTEYMDALLIYILFSPTLSIDIKG